MRLNMILPGEKVNDDYDGSVRALSSHSFHRPDCLCNVRELND